VEDTIEYSIIIHENLVKAEQVRLTLSTFKDVYYVGFRKYYLSFMGEYLPSNEGVTIPATFEVMTNLINGVIDLAADNEGKQLLEEALKRCQSSNS
jgi:hypothetical protein